MSIRERLEEDLKDAMRQKHVLRRTIIRTLRSEIHNAEIAQKTELDEDGIVGVLTRQAQQRRESIEAYTKASRDDLVEQEESELAIIMEYLPEQMSSDEIRALVEKAVAEVGAAGPGDMGKVMGRIMPQVRGKADGREVSTMVTELLSSLGG